MRIRKGDLLILVVLLLIGGTIIYQQVTPNNIGNIAVLEINGEIIAEFNLEQEYGQFHVETDQGYNILAFEDGRVKVEEADCPDQTCVRFGWIERIGQTIVCLPHRVIVRIENVTQDFGLDGVTY